MEKKELMDARKIANNLKPIFNLGKEGMSENFLTSVDDYLQAHGMVKIKVSIATNRDELKEYAKKVSEGVEADIVETKGYTFTLVR